MTGKVTPVFGQRHHASWHDLAQRDAHVRTAAQARRASWEKHLLTPVRQTMVDSANTPD